MESELGSHFEVPSVDRKKHSKLVINLIIANLIVLAGLIGIIVYSKSLLNKSKNPIANPLDHLAQQYADSLPDSFLPDSFAADVVYQNPATNQASRGTCWAWATMYILETQYRAQGIKQGYLRENEYVKFSIQAFAAYLGNYCKAHNTAKVCQYGGFLNKNSTNDNQVEAFPYFLKEISDLNLKIVPDTVCPYVPTKSPETDFSCPNFTKATESNPIKFTFKNMRTAFDIRGVKQLLYSAQRPLGIGTPLGTVNYMIPCEGSVFSDTDACVNKWFPCPESQDGEFCYNLEIEGRTRDGIFLAIDKAERQTEFGGHAMNIMAYNDNWVYNNRISGPKTLEAAKGCFILHNSWRADGHSISYLMGQRTLENEQTSCPNHKSPETWIPATLECIKENVGDISLCSKDIKRVRGHGLTNGPDLLKCIDASNASCVPQDNYRYVLLRSGSDVDAQELPNGLHKISVIRWKEGHEPEVISLNRLPFWAIGSILTPVTPVDNNPNECGFYALPYQTVENMIRRSWDLFDNFKASDIEVEFEPSSYLRAQESKSFNTQWLESSTYNVTIPEFDGPIPFKLVY